MKKCAKAGATVTGVLVLLGAAALIAVPASAEVDLAGNWQARDHQDWIERGPGPDVDDYLGLGA